MQKKISSEKYSISKKLRKENKSNELFEIMLSRLSIEEIIALKLELITKSVGTAIFGLPLWSSLNLIVKDAVLKYALANNSSKRKTANYLGLNLNQLNKLIKKYGIVDYFNSEEKKQDDNN